MYSASLGRAEARLDRPLAPSLVPPEDPKKARSDLTNMVAQAVPESKMPESPVLVCIEAR